MAEIYNMLNSFLSASVGFYHHRIDNVACFISMDSEENELSTTEKPLETTAPVI